MSAQNAPAAFRTSGDDEELNGAKDDPFPYDLAEAQEVGYSQQLPDSFSQSFGDPDIGLGSFTQPLQAEDPGAPPHTVPGWDGPPWFDWGVGLSEVTTRPLADPDCDSAYGSKNPSPLPPKDPFCIVGSDALKIPLAPEIPPAPGTFVFFEPTFPNGPSTFDYFDESRLDEIVFPPWSEPSSQDSSANTISIEKRPRTIDLEISVHTSSDTQRRPATPVKRQKVADPSWRTDKEALPKPAEYFSRLFAEFCEEFRNAVSSRLQNYQDLVNNAMKRQGSESVQTNVRLQLAKFASELDNERLWDNTKMRIDVMRLVRYSSDRIADLITAWGGTRSSEDRNSRIDATCSLLPKVVLITEVMTNTKAFDKLLQNLEAGLDYGGGHVLRMVRETTVNSTLRFQSEGPERYHVHFEVRWDVNEFMQSQFNEELPPVGSVVVLTGSDTHAQATTCAEYVRTVWPDTAQFFLSLLEDHFLSFSSRASYYEPDIGHESSVSLKINVEHHGTQSESNVSGPEHDQGAPRNKMRISVRASELYLIVELAEQLAWAVCALSTSPLGEQLAYAEPTFSAPLISGGAPVFEVSATYSPLPLTKNTCWLPLFCGAAIAHHFPIPARGGEVGLEIPLDLLVELGGARHAVEYEGGLVMKGFSHMFIPVEKSGDRVQWHAVSSKNIGQRLTYEDALQQCQTRATLEEVGFEDLRRTRAILGWCSVATSRLGSDLVDYKNIDYSRSAEAAAGLRFAGGQLGFQQFGMAALDFKLGPKDGKCHFQRTGTYDRVVSAAEKTPIVLYDTSGLRAWLVTASDVILHMIQNRHRLEPYEVDGQEIELSTHIPLGSSAKKVLLKNGKVRLRDDEDCTFKNEVFTIWSLLELLVDQNVSRERNAQGAQLKTDTREHLMGFEYKAVVQDRSPFKLKTTQLKKSSGGWPSLIRDIDALVLLADGFGDLILPADGEKARICSAWQRLPEGRDFMATTTSIVRDLYDVAGCRADRKFLTTTKLQWHQGDSELFDACEDRTTCSCNRLQQIMSSTCFGTIVPPKRVADRGAVIFGHTEGFDLLHALRRKQRVKAEQANGLYSQPNKPLSPIIIPKDIEDTPAPDSAYQSASDMSANSTPNSILSHASSSPQDSRPDLPAAPGLFLSVPALLTASQNETYFGCTVACEDASKGKKRMWPPPDTPCVKQEPQRPLRRVEALTMQQKRARNV